LRDFKKVKVLKQKVENWIFKTREKFDLIVLDPPRSGAGVKIMQSICKKAKEKIIYIACDPASLARDTAVAKENGWLLEKVEVYDFFPMTHHFESVAVFTRG
jgi:tRNA/tmRNA/rRNA uracil-C5-methylase (TrmA/RlmC/RlmD family)